ncbi:MAG: hypothetical protein IK038_02760 [Bacteroidaceae bacterium]|nr:hypothetical protein [Bacteroidaceae bacterium]
MLKIRVHERLNEAFNPMTVKIGNQVWMAENLDIDDGGEGVRCNQRTGHVYYNNVAACRVIKNLKGWRLPTREDLEELYGKKGEVNNDCGMAWRTEYYGLGKTLNTALHIPKTDHTLHFGFKSNHNPAIWTGTLQGLEELPLVIEIDGNMAKTWRYEFFDDYVAVRLIKE